jgi:hypothetical protein
VQSVGKNLRRHLALLQLHVVVVAHRQEREHVPPELGVADGGVEQQG